MPQPQTAWDNRPFKKGSEKDEMGVTTDWVAEHANDEGIVLAEVDENPDLYDVQAG